MTDVIAPQAQVIWDVTNNAVNDKGDALDPSKISASDWAKLKDAGARMRDHALLLANAPKVFSAPPGSKLEGEGGPGAATAAQVQGYIDANTAEFADHARMLAQSGDAIAEASSRKDAGPVFTVSSNLDQVCDGCHQKFWTPEQAR